MSDANYVVVLSPTGGFPCEWDDLVDVNSQTRVTMYTLREVLDDPPEQTGYTEAGIFSGNDGVYDVVVDAPQLTYDIAVQQLKSLSEKTGEVFVLDEYRSFDGNI